MFIGILVLCHGLTVFHNFIYSRGTIYNQTKDPGFIQGASSTFIASVIPDTEELYRVSNEELSRLPNITNISNVKSADNIDGLKNVSTTHYKTSNFIHIQYLLVRSVVDTIK